MIGIESLVAAAHCTGTAIPGIFAAQLGMHLI
jgi:hypothetical protein